MKNKNVSTKTIIAPFCALLLLLSAPRTLSAATIDGETYNSVGTAFLVVATTAFGTFIERRLNRKFDPLNLGQPSVVPLCVSAALLSSNVEQNPYWLYNALMVGGEVGFGTAIGLAFDWLLEFRKMKQQRKKREELEARIKAFCPELLPVFVYSDCANSTHTTPSTKNTNKENQHIATP